MPDENLDYAEQGTPIAGYEERGPYHCEDCIHRLDPKSDICTHPAVIADPELANRLVDGGVKINLEHGCCSYVNQGSEPILLILRHGETGLNKEKKFRSLRNVPLNDIGLQQAQDAAEFLKEYPIKKIVCSPLDRAFHTALFVEEACGAPVTKDAALLPWDLGNLAGKPREENKDVLQHHVDNSEEPLPGGESLDEFRKKQFAVFDKYIGEASADNLILLVAHTSTLTTLNQWIDDNYSGQPESDDDDVEPGGVCALYSDEDKDDFKLIPIWGEPKLADYGS